MYAAVWNISKNMLIIDLNDLTLCTVLTPVCKLLVDAINITCNVQRRETNLQRFLQFNKCMPVSFAVSNRKQPQAFASFNKNESQTVQIAGNIWL